MQTLFSNMKVNNEIELCEVADTECKVAIEKELLRSRISYFVRWQKRGFLARKEVCIICINENVTEQATDIVNKICEERGYEVNFLLNKSRNKYL